MWFDDLSLVLVYGSQTQKCFNDLIGLHRYVIMLLVINNLYQHVGNVNSKMYSCTKVFYHIAGIFGGRRFDKFGKLRICDFPNHILLMNHPFAKLFTNHCETLSLYGISFAHKPSLQTPCCKATT